MIDFSSLQNVFESMTPDMQQAFMDTFASFLQWIQISVGGLGGTAVLIYGYYRQKLTRSALSIQQKDSSLSLQEAKQQAAFEVAKAGLSDVREMFMMSQEQLAKSTEVMNAQSALFMELIKGQNLSTESILSAKTLLDESNSISGTLESSWKKLLEQKEAENKSIGEYTETLKEE